MTRQSLNSDSNSFLKTAARRLIRAAGGVESAAMATRVGKSILSEYQNPAMSDRHMPVDIVIELERDSGTDHVTQALCRLAGGYFVRVPERSALMATDFAAMMPELGKEIGDVWSETAKALADGKINEDERQRLIAEIEGGLSSMIAARNALETAGGK